MVAVWDETSVKNIERIYSLLIFFGVTTGILGSIATVSWGVFLFSREKGFPFYEVFAQFLKTDLASMAVYRALLLALLFSIFIVGWKHIFGAKIFSVFEALLFACLFASSYALWLYW
ncbi:MAG: hypothetical protein G01um10148_562 [Parcubacteria group bacterium Gr01-1014_8]|nr:MAG: hypothetical protein G01um10148_562 [Parcubacteria group bacterium Gr01-1014_8]